MELFGDCAAIGALDVMEVAPDQTGATAQLGAGAIARFLERRFL
jgi:arginase family enzyme